MVVGIERNLDSIDCSARIDGYADAINDVVDNSHCVNLK
jgi:hypothetical protein